MKPSEITSGAFSSKFTLPMICIYVNHAAIHREKKQWQPSFKGGRDSGKGGANAPPPPLNEPLLYRLIYMHINYCLLIYNQ